MNEHEIQKLAVLALRKLGFTCCVTSNRKKTSNTPGTPDVFVHVKNGLWIALEFKQPAGRLSKEQEIFNDTKTSQIIMSVEEAIETCRIGKSWIGGNYSRRN